MNLECFFQLAFLHVGGAEAFCAAVGAHSKSNCGRITRHGGGRRGAVRAPVMGDFGKIRTGATVAIAANPLKSEMRA
ncbi:hypothetical protein AB0425_36435 [Actinosynnema sp. NPDC051121]